MASTALWRFWIDTGGTFTDCLALAPDGSRRRLKVLSTGAIRGEVAALGPDGLVVLRGLPMVVDDLFVGYELRLASGLRTARITAWHAARRAVALAEDAARGWQVGDVVDLTAGEEAPVVAMRILTDTRLGEALPPAELRLATTRATNALLERKGARVAFFVTAGFGDLLRIGDQRRPDLFALRVEKPPPLHGPVVEVVERVAVDGSIVQPLDTDALQRAAMAMRGEGIEVAAVALLHSHRHPAHERAVAALLRGWGFRHVSVSAELAPFIKLGLRAETAVVDAVLAPVMERYLTRVASAVEESRFLVMTSAGGLVRRAAYRPKDSLLSGPAGGVAGAAACARRAGLSRVLTFDMGGTSTDVSRWQGDFDYRFHHAVGPARVFAPALRVESVAAGGGSVCRFDGAALVVGPESAGAAPGPACYGGGGPLTLTDVHLLLGRLDVATFAVPVVPAAAEARLQAMIETVRAQGIAVPERREILEGFLAIADERMAEAVRQISVREGYDPAEYALVAFGGAGGLHACAVASRLGMDRVLFPGDAGLLSAAGLGAALPERFAEEEVLAPLVAVSGDLEVRLARLEQQARADLAADGFAGEGIVVRRSEVEVRLAGQDGGLVVAARPVAAIATNFGAAYAARYGYPPPKRRLEVVRVRIVVSPSRPEAAREVFEANARPPVSSARVSRDGLEPGDRVQGPAVVSDQFSTLYVPAQWQAVVGDAGAMLLVREDRVRSSVATDADLIDLELFTGRFLALVEDMGALLQRCALSVNVKERLDFSCALLDAAGELVANAPHVPVHLGALGLCVRHLAAAVPLRPGDVVVTNHPAFGGSHLPDVTLVAPVHAADGRLVGYVANRAHHAEIGGVYPGSMSPDARRLVEEGVVLEPFYLVRAGRPDWDGIRVRFASGLYPSRAVDENIADLEAQLAAIRQGTIALRSLIDQHGVTRVERFMTRLKGRAADAVFQALVRLRGGPWQARDSLDDGTPIQVCCKRVGGGKRWRIDFAGSGAVHPGNLNATPAIVRSAVLYVLRVLAGRDLPLNEGLMRDIDLVVPAGLLAPRFVANPDACPAVAGGNVETSQRVVDVLFQALGLAACSQGTMNNLIFGQAQASCYETIGGGTGAGPGFSGCDGVHSHMTNTAITDPEILETRLPVRLERFAIRRGSGGAGTFAGGSGLERRIRFLAPFSLSLLSQRRGMGPPGGHGGLAGAPGAQWIERADGAHEVLPGCAQAEVARGDQLVILTPGGGGWGGRGIVDSPSVCRDGKAAEGPLMEER